MIPLQFTATAEVGYVEIPDEAFLALIVYESYKGPRDYTALSEKLDKLPAINAIDYSGHYGANVFFTKDCEATVEEMQAVFTCISDHLALCRAWLDENRPDWQAR